ncbi:hypothetical protein AVI50_17095 (plasmid) [Piscirickettsia salmonis]|nr:hypothetical protein AVI50_17095 [Piscirickettsia salmonis]
MKEFIGHYDSDGEIIKFTSLLTYRLIVKRQSKRPKKTLMKKMKRTYLKSICLLMIFNMIPAPLQLHGLRYQKKSITISLASPVSTLFKIMSHT